MSDVFYRWVELDDDGVLEFTTGVDSLKRLITMVRMVADDYKSLGETDKGYVAGGAGGLLSAGLLHEAFAELSKIGIIVYRESWRAPDAGDAALVKLQRIRDTLSNAPECDKYDDDDVITCGWKSDMIRVRRLLGVVDNSDETE